LKSKGVLGVYNTVRTEQSIFTHYRPHYPILTTST
jgi:hypothetical protein